MGKNGGAKPTETILTLEEALMRFKRKRSEAGAQTRGETVTESNVQEVELSAAVEHKGQGKATGYLGTAGESGATGELSMADLGTSVSAQRDEANAEMSANEDIVAVIDGIPRTLAELERMAAAEKAYDQDFPETALETAEAEQDDAEIGDVDFMPPASRRSLIRDYAFTAMGTAMMVLVAFLMTRVSIVKDHTNLMAQAQGVATPALKASSLMTAANDLISTLVIVPDTDVQEASARPLLKTDELEARIKDTLKLRAFTDIGVSVSRKGDAYLAGEVYSLDEARKIAHIVHSVNGVSQVHFLHPDVRSAEGPAFFGITTESSPAVWGAKVQSVFIGSPADKAGLKPDDVISEFDGKTIPDAKTFNELIAQYSPGQRVQFRAWHDGQPEYLVARIGDVTTVASR
jgi:hypothetical protein